MFDGRKILGLIPARGGSKGVPRKNVRRLGDKPLIAWTIEAAKKSKYIDRLILSSEDEEIIDVARKHGCDVPFVRPPELSRDATPGIEPVLHALETLGDDFDYLVLLQPTSPFRSAEDIDEAIRICMEGGTGSCVSVCESAKHPAWMYTINADGMLYPWIDTDAAVPRQQLGKVYALNGALYVVHIPALLKQRAFVVPEKTLAYPMPPERSLDIDTEFDFLLCQLLVEETRADHVF